VLSEADFKNIPLWKGEISGWKYLRTLEGKRMAAEIGENQRKRERIKVMIEMMSKSNKRGHLLF
jgi:hypothetical protein